MHNTIILIVIQQKMLYRNLLKPRHVLYSHINIAVNSKQDT